MLLEPLRDACFDEKPVVFGPMASATFLWNPRRLGMALARYKFAGKMLSGLRDVAEIGCADGFCSRVVSQEVLNLHLFDRDPQWVKAAQLGNDFAQSVRVHDITEGPLPQVFDGIFMLDVLEHIDPRDEIRALWAITKSLRPHGVCVVGVPSMESQRHARALSKEGHVNIKSGEDLRDTLRRFFHNVVMFGMNDEMLHMGFLPMCHYLLALCVGPKGKELSNGFGSSDGSSVPHEG